MKMRNLVRAAVLTLAVLLLLGGCGSSREEKTVVASIDEYDVSYELMRYFVRNLMRDEAGDDAAYWTEERAAERRDDVIATALETMRQQFAVLSLCKRYGIDRENEAIVELVNAKTDAVIEDYGGKSAYAAALKEANLTDSVYRFLTTVEVCEEELYYAMLDAGTLETDDAKIEPLVRGDAFIRVKQILIANDRGRTAEEDLALAQEAHKRALAGEDFDKLVKEYGEDLFMFNNKDGYYFCRGTRYTAFEDAAFALKIGGVSGIVETPAGYSILLRCEKEKKYLDSHMAELCGAYRDAQFSLALEQRAAEMTIVTRETLDKYTLLTMD